MRSFFVASLFTSLGDLQGEGQVMVPRTSAMLMDAHGTFPKRRHEGSADPRGWSPDGPRGVPGMSCLQVTHPKSYSPVATVAKSSLEQQQLEEWDARARVDLKDA